MTGRPLRIVITADPELPVPPRHYGGIERVVAMLVEGLVAKGHEVTLVAHADSRVPCRLVAYPAARGRSGVESWRNMSAVASAVDRDTDVVHSFGRLGYLLPILPRRLPKVMSYQRAVTKRSVRLGHALSRGTLRFTGCSRRLIEPVADIGSWHVVYNGVPVERYVSRPTVAADAPLMFLGRIEHIKGTHVAIEVAKAAKRRLVIAGNVPEAAEHQDYFRTRIQPHVDGRDIAYVGPVDDARKNELLGQAAALLMPILWEEPFGIVMAEALACGTPVIGFGRGSVPEVVEHGVTGFVCETAAELVDVVARIPTLDRRRCRCAAEARFSAQAIVNEYEALYRGLLHPPTARALQRDSIGV